MFSPTAIVTDAFIEYALRSHREAFPGADRGDVLTLERVTRQALQTLANCDCPYHDINHTLFVTDVGFSILKGRMLLYGDVAPGDWLNAVMAMLYHDVGFLRGLLPGDRAGCYVIDPEGSTIEVPEGSTDAYLNPYHVTRSCMYVRQRFASEGAISAEVVAQHIEMTRFPVPQVMPYLQLDSMSSLVRAADLIGQMADPDYVLKLSRLYQEFQESGVAETMGLEHAGDLRANYPDFFYRDVYPYLGEGLRYLRQTKDGQQWIANLFHHVHTEQRDAPQLGPERAGPTLASVAPLRSI